MDGLNDVLTSFRYPGQADASDDVHHQLRNGDQRALWPERIARHRAVTIRAVVANRLRKEYSKGPPRGDEARIRQVLGGWWGEANNLVVCSSNIPTAFLCFLPGSTRMAKPSPPQKEVIGPTVVPPFWGGGACAKGGTRSA